MENNEIKENIAKNISSLRKQNKLTQLELAEQLHYSDKAISRWERGDTLPDIDILCKICEMFGVTFEYLISSHTEEEKIPQNNTLKKELSNKVTITLMAVCLIWLAATIIYVYADIISGATIWKIFVWAVPASAVMAGIFNFIWGKKKYSIILFSILNWTLIAAIYIEYLTYNIWLIFIIGVPIQVAIILWSQLHPRRTHKENN